MTAGEAVLAQLMADATVVSLVGNRVYANQLTEGSDLPAAVYQVISDVPQSSLDGSPASRLHQVRVQVDVYARPTVAGGGGYRQAHAVADAIDSVLSALAIPPGSAGGPLSGWLESSRDLFDDESQYHRVSMDFSIWR